MNEKFVSQYTYVVISNDGGNFYAMRSPNYIVYVKFDFISCCNKSPSCKRLGASLPFCVICIDILTPTPNELASTQKLLVNKYYEAI